MQSSEIICHVAYERTDVSEEHITSIFREGDGGVSFSRKVGSSINHTASYPKRMYSSSRMT
jgi:hypothetical protein